MKGIINTNKLHLIFFLLFLLINYINSESLTIKLIPDANLNATAAFADLESFEKDNYLFFSFDFNYHNQVPHKEKDIAYFKITSELFFTYSDFKFYFLDKKQEEVTYSDIDLQNYNLWKHCYLISREKENNEYDYYIQIQRYGEKDKKNTVIIGIPIYKKKGQITVENLYSLPENVLEKKNKFSNFNNWPKNHEYHSNLNNNNNYKYDYNYRDYHYRYHRHYEYRLFGNSGLCFIGILLLQLWIVIFVIYCLVNRRKKSQLAIVIGNIPQ